MQLLITAAGRGQRFRDAGYTTPKPLIPLAGVELLVHVLRSFPLGPADRVAVVGQRQHRLAESPGLRAWQEQAGVAVQWLEIETVLPGQLATALWGIERLGWQGPLWIHNCDTAFGWVEGLESISGDASMPVFEAEGSHWSFGRELAERPGWAVEIAEKRRISNLASIGLYGFADAERFRAEAAAYSAHRRDDGERYVAELLSHGLDRGWQVQLPRLQGVRVMGTPEELARPNK